MLFHIRVDNTLRPHEASWDKPAMHSDVSTDGFVAGACRCRSRWMFTVEFE